jgi:hypothetical protein
MEAKRDALESILNKGKKQAEKPMVEVPAAAHVPPAKRHRTRGLLWPPITENRRDSLSAANFVE